MKPRTMTVFASAIACALGLATSHTANATTDPHTDQDTRVPATNVTTDAGAAQANANSATTLNAVEVSASRIVRPDLTVPTPQVPIPRTTLNLDVHLNVGAALLDLPYFRGSSTPQTGAPNNGGGNSGVDIRGLGTARTLTLIDGQRFIGSTNMNNLPSILVKRVDVVTGGASASWGSDAVAGVVNVILDRDLTGVKLDTSMGISSQHDALQRKYAIAAGTGFDNQKGHLIFGADYVDRAMVWPGDNEDRRQTARWALVPIGGGRSEIMPDTGNINHSPGGSITSGIFKGQVFNPDGSIGPSPYGPPISGVTSSGYGAPNIFDTIALIAPVKVYSALLGARYDITNTVTVTAQFRTSKQWGDYPKYLINQDGIRITTDNPYLSDSLRQQMMAAGESSFTMGRQNTDINQTYMDYARGTNQFTVGLDGAVGSWHWNTYASYGKLYDNDNEPHHLIVKNWKQAVDAVVDPMTKLPVCRITLTTPGTGCVPIDVIGYGNASAAALDYVTGVLVTRVNQTQKVASASIQGEPFELPAGFVSVVGGLEWRADTQRTWVPQSQLDNPFELGNTPRLAGRTNVKEGFIEVLAPLLKDRLLLQDLSVDIAARRSHYSESGSINSWKIGAVDDLGAGFRARVDYSRDIRAPNISELFASPSTSLTQIVDPLKNVSVLAASISGGNTALKPEIAKTFTAGLSWSSPAISGLSVSMDYFNIKVGDVISGLNAVTTMQQCVLGNAQLCSRIVRDADGNLVSVSTQLINLSEYKTDGVDLDTSYQMPASIFGVPGKFNIRGLATYVHKLEVNNGVSTLAYVGNTAGGSSAGGFGVPRWKAIVTPSFDADSFSLYARLNYLSSGYYDRHQVITNNSVPNYFYTDLGARYKFGRDKTAEIYFDVTNVTDRQQPHGANASFSAYYSSMGRYYTLGARVSF